MSSRRSAVALALLALAGCGDLPRPFAGSPGATARRLSQPPPARLAVQSPVDALLPDAAGAGFAGDVAAALVDNELPAVAEPAKRGDWRLLLKAELQGGEVTPSFELRDQKDLPKGVTQGAPVSSEKWSMADPATLKAVAAQAAPGSWHCSKSSRRRGRRATRTACANRPAKVYVAEVTGAPGDGDTSLTRQMLAQLPGFGEQVTDKPDAADFAVAGQVATAPGLAGTVRIELQWIVTDSRGAERGRIVQLNEVPPESVSGRWGDVAVSVASQAAGGVKDVILQQTGNRRGTAPGS